MMAMMERSVVDTATPPLTPAPATTLAENQRHQYQQQQQQHQRQQHQGGGDDQSPPLAVHGIPGNPASPGMGMGDGGVLRWLAAKGNMLGVESYQAGLASPLADRAGPGSSGGGGGSSNSSSRSSLRAAAEALALSPEHCWFRSSVLAAPWEVRRACVR